MTTGSLDTPPRTPAPALPAGPGPAGPRLLRARRALRALRRPAAVGGAGALAVAAVVAASSRPAAPPLPPPAQVLPLTASAAAPVCPGPQTLQAPDGAASAYAGGPTDVGAVVAQAGLLRATGTGPGTGTDTGTGPGAGTGTGAGVSPSGALAPMPGDTAVVRAEPFTGSRGRAAVLRTEVAGGATTPGSAAPLRLDVTPPPGGTAPPVAAATQVTLSRRTDLRGLSAITCQPPTTAAWLVGGGTQPGRRARLLLANPTAAPAVVDLTVLGPDGRLDAPAGQGLLVPAGGRRVVLLDALAPDLGALAVHVVARSGRVAASLHDEVLRGLEPGGTDSIAPSAGPSRRQVVPGLSIVASDDPGDDPGDAGADVVRVAVPGTSDAVIRVRLLGADGPVALPGAVRTVAAGAVVDLPVTGVRPGTYTAVVEADVPVVAAGLVGRESPGAAELAWSASAGAVRDLVAVATPAGDGLVRILALGAPEGAVVTVLPLGRDGSPGAPRRLVVTAGTTRTLPLDDGTAAVLVRPEASGVHLALLMSADRGGLVAAASVRPPAPADVQAPVVVEDPTAGLGRRRG